MNDFETVRLDDLDRVAGGFFPMLMGILGAAAPLIGKLVDSGRKNGGDGKGSQIGDAAGQMFSSFGGIGGGGPQSQDSQPTEDA